MDEELSWRKHYNCIANKLAKAAGILCRIRHYINKKTLITFTTVLCIHALNIESLLGETKQNL